MSALLELSDFVFILDRDGRVIHANEGFLEVWHCSRDSAMGRRFSDFLENREVGAMLDRQVQQVLASGRGTKEVVFYVRPNGLSLEHEYVFDAFRGTDGKISGVVGTTRNVTERNRAGTHAAFTTALGERLAQSGSPSEIMQLTTREVGRQLAADRCYICEWDPSLDHCEVWSDWAMDEAPSLVGSYQLSNYGPRAWWELLTAGNVAIEDIRLHDLAKDFFRHTIQWESGPTRPHGFAGKMPVSQLSSLRRASGVPGPDKNSFFWKT